MISASVAKIVDESRAVLARLGQNERKALLALGKYAQKAAKHSLRTKAGPAPAGAPPHSHTGTLRRHIYYRLTPAPSVIIGPLRLPGTTYAVPGTLEYGGPIPRMRNKRRRIRVLGKPGEIRLGRPYGATARLVKGTGKRVTYAKLRTAAQVERANWLNEQLYGPLYFVGKIHPHPFMRPALAYTMGRLKEVFSKLTA